jgi:hypothetical protein
VLRQRLEVELLRLAQLHEPLEEVHVLRVRAEAGVDFLLQKLEILVNQGGFFPFETNGGGGGKRTSTSCL